MLKEQTEKIINRIAIYYPSFKGDNSDERYDTISEEWHKHLQHYDYEDIDNKLTTHLQVEGLNKTIPKPYDLTRYVNTISQKNQSAVYITKCKYCGKTMKMDIAYDKHIERHNSIIYMKSREHLLNKTYNVDKLFNGNEKDFNIVYEKFIEDLYEVIPESVEKKCLLNIINSRYGFEIESGSVIADIAGAIGGN